MIFLKFDHSKCMIDEIFKILYQKNHLYFIIFWFELIKCFDKAKKIKKLLCSNIDLKHEKNTYKKIFKLNFRQLLITFVKKTFLKIFKISI